MTHTVRLLFDTDPLVMRAVRKQTATAATVFGATEYQAGRVELAVAEALSNAHEHAYDGKSGPIELEMMYALDEFAVTIHDDGKKFWIAQWPNVPNPRPGNGYGLEIIKRLMDEADFQDGGSKGGTTLRMAIHLR
jgi:anti-sigma regulatory factor (Ser/Thr protein kinase)